MKELVLKKQSELEEIYRSVHMDVESATDRQILINFIDSGYHQILSLCIHISAFLRLCFDVIIKCHEFVKRVEGLQFRPKC